MYEKWGIESKHVTFGKDLQTILLKTFLLHLVTNITILFFLKPKFILCDSKRSKQEEIDYFKLYLVSVIIALLTYFIPLLARSQ